MKSDNWIKRGFQNCWRANKELFFFGLVILGVIGVIGIFVLTNYFPLIVLTLLSLLLVGMVLFRLGEIIHLTIICHFIDAYDEIKMEKRELTAPSSFDNIVS